MAKKIELRVLHPGVPTDEEIMEIYRALKGDVDDDEPEEEREDEPAAEPDSESGPGER